MASSAASSAPSGAGSARTRLHDALMRSWLRPQPDALATALRPLAAVYDVLQRRDRTRRERRALELPQPTAPVVVVGNFVVGGAGKTPTTIALVEALRQAGYLPGVVSRGHGRREDETIEVGAGDDALRVGDEPLLIHRRTAAPVWVGDDRRAAALALQQAHPEVDVIIADDGLQHRQLRREVEVVVFDERGVGNGLLLPAGPLREALPPTPEPRMLVLYNHDRPSTRWPGALAQRRLGRVWPLAAWLAGTADMAERAGAAQPIVALRGRPLIAMAGIAVPERFYAALEAAGLQIERLSLPDHHDYAGAPPWPANAREIVTTEKDAVKLRRWAEGEARIWVVGLDLLLPDDFVAALLARLESVCRPPRAPRTPFSPSSPPATDAS